MSDLTGLAAIAALQAGKVLDNAATKNAMWMNSRNQLLVHRRNLAIYWIASNQCIDHAVTLKWKVVGE